MSFHLSLSPTSSSSLTRFRPVLMTYNDKLALFKSFSILSIHRRFWPPIGRFPIGFQLRTTDGHLSLFILAIWPYHFILIFRTVFSAISALSLLVLIHCLPYIYCAISDAAINFRMHSTYFAWPLSSTPD